MIGIIEFEERDVAWKIRHDDGHVETLCHTGSGIAAPDDARGMNHRRFQRLREMEQDYYFHRVAQTTKEYFVDIYNIDALEVIGTQDIRDAFINAELLVHDLRVKLVDYVDGN